MKCIFSKKFWKNERFPSTSDKIQAHSPRQHLKSAFSPASFSLLSYIAGGNVYESVLQEHALPTGYQETLKNYADLNPTIVLLRFDAEKIRDTYKIIWQDRAALFKVVKY